MRWGRRGAGHLRMGGGHLPWVVYVLCVRPYWPPCRAPVGAVRVGRGGARVWVPLGTGVRGGCVCTGRPCGWWRRPVLPRSSPSFPCVGFRGRRCCSRPLCLGGDVSTAEVPCGGPLLGVPCWCRQPVLRVVVSGGVRRCCCGMRKPRAATAWCAPEWRRSRSSYVWYTCLLVVPSDWLHLNTM